MPNIKYTNDQFLLMDFVKQHGTGNITRVFGEECLNEDGTIMSIADQAAVITHYLKLQNNVRYVKPYAEKGKQLLQLWQEFIEGQPQRNSGDVVSESPSQYLANLFNDVASSPFPPQKNPRFTFIDLFAGIGGFRMALQDQGGECVFSSEWNEMAQRTYYANYGEVPFGDITNENTKRFIPNDFDVLCAGFPCQPFSIAGVSKKKSLGRETGFKDKTQGTLFFDVADIINRYRPKAFFLENVKNLCSHDKGNTFKIIRETLEELDYSIHYQVMDGKSYVPQHRERILIVGFDKHRYYGKETFVFPTQTEPKKCVRDILDECVPEKYTLTDKLWNYLQNYAVKQHAKGNGFGFGLVNLDGITRTLSARYYKDGSEILIPQEGKNPRRLTPRECARLMGYPEKFIIDRVSDVQAYRQCGNSVVVPLITAVAEQLVKTMEKYNND